MADYAGSLSISMSFPESRNAARVLYWQFSRCKPPAELLSESVTIYYQLLPPVHGRMVIEETMEASTGPKVELVLKVRVGESRIYGERAEVQREQVFLK